MMVWLTEHTVMYGTWGVLAAVLLLPALESALPLLGTLLPGQTAVVMGGMLACHGQVPLYATLAMALVGAVLGNVVGFAAGRRWNTRLLDRIPQRLLRPRHTARALSLIQRGGGRAVFVGRFTAVLRTLVPTLCGMSGMSLRSYLAWSVLSSAVWAPVFVLVGYGMGSAPVL
ncbi:DedA family protein [Streptomyces spiramyceticus]|uniref:DedA family protein n=1 Tax=Streptomyces spiramyceticus TaxID=299717 RepID=UPI00237AFAF0|nr:DedA family protein [Streptomyces spiramyceticus]